jgi:TetR/AcrR family transcriptional repressor of nem operon
MAKFLFVYRGAGETVARMTPAEKQQHMQKWEKWLGEGMQKGWLLDPGDGLTQEGRVVGARVVTDGPFVESKEVVGGFSIIQADTIDAAAKLAKGCPVVLVGGTVEVRPLAGYTTKSRGGFFLICAHFGATGLTAGAARGINIPTGRYSPMRQAKVDSPTREKLLDAAQELMLAKGFTATSVDEVCDAAGLTKGSFFHYFESKEHLGRVVAERYCTAAQQRFEAAPFRRLEDPVDRVLGFIDYLLERARSSMFRGCLLGTFVQELSQTHPGIRSVCAAGFEGLADFLKQDLVQAKRHAAARARWAPQGLAEHMIAVMQGAIILAKAKQDLTVVEESLGHLKEYLKNVFGR